MIEILPALLGADPLALGDATDSLTGAPVRYLHLDVMDGRFVTDISFGVRTVAALRRRTDLPLDVHLQVAHPEDQLDALVKAGVDLVTVHVEATAHIARVVRRLQQEGVDAGLAINPGTPLAAVEELLGQITQVTVMTSNPGTSDFLGWTLDKIRRLRALLTRHELTGVHIAADGGVTEARAKALYEAGADRLIAGSAVFQAPGGSADGVARLRKAALA
ncbi:ribulose-phosphate 3-epimerase [Actinoplanes octamycinicus]|uniref:Ribulose-phosphate 3-epimerase n=1 Tax=Actinoplanes octamycinicus TaxID=135948 RepID=A0A7W7H4R1_9ACTN|nr:ribulose-phosphate 3-epimerase [Actinoplanes octamycinicus]MBB4743961.1 ribulose-phosphate 3-epimerase [Actinoplanes octamycinicus]GIE58585.1 hypothetical protein Aoc01nite_39870 [Actinoplanes octamycinicus]